MCAPAARQRRNALDRFTSSTASQSASGYATASARRMIPALLTTMSRRPMRSRTPGTSASTASRCWRLATRPAVRTPHSDASAAAASAGALVLACRTTSAPAFASARAIAAPSPREEPVTSATRPARSKGERGAAAAVICATTIIRDRETALVDQLNRLAGAGGGIDRLDERDAFPPVAAVAAGRRLRGHRPDEVLDDALVRGRVGDDRRRRAHGRPT